MEQSGAPSDAPSEALESPSFPRWETPFLSPFCQALTIFIQTRGEPLGTHAAGTSHHPLNAPHHPLRRPIGEWEVFKGEMTTKLSFIVKTQLSTLHSSPYTQTLTKFVNQIIIHKVLTKNNFSRTYGMFGSVGFKVVWQELNGFWVICKILTIFFYYFGV